MISTSEVKSEFKNKFIVYIWGFKESLGFKEIADFLRDKNTHLNISDSGKRKGWENVFDELLTKFGLERGNKGLIKEFADELENTNKDITEKAFKNKFKEKFMDKFVASSKLNLDGKTADQIMKDSAPSKFGNLLSSTGYNISKPFKFVSDKLGLGTKYYYAWWLFDSIDDFNNLVHHPHDYPRNKGELKTGYSEIGSKELQKLLSGQKSKGRVTGNYLGSMGEVKRGEEFKSKKIPSVLRNWKKGQIIALGAARAKRWTSHELRGFTEKQRAKFDVERLIWKWTKWDGTSGIKPKPKRPRVNRVEVQRAHHPNNQALKKEEVRIHIIGSGFRYFISLRKEEKTFVFKDTNGYEIKLEKAYEIKNKEGKKVGEAFFNIISDEKIEAIINTKNANLGFYDLGYMWLNGNDKLEEALEVVDEINPNKIEIQFEPDKIKNYGEHTLTAKGKNLQRIKIKKETFEFKKYNSPKGPNFKSIGKPKYEDGEIKNIKIYIDDKTERKIINGKYFVTYTNNETSRKEAVRNALNIDIKGIELECILPTNKKIPKSGELQNLILDSVGHNSNVLKSIKEMVIKRGKETIDYYQGNEDKSKVKKRKKERRNKLIIDDAGHINIWIDSKNAQEGWYEIDCFNEKGTDIGVSTNVFQITNLGGGDSDEIKIDSVKFDPDKVGEGDTTKCTITGQNLDQAERIMLKRGELGSEVFIFPPDRTVTLNPNGGDVEFKIEKSHFVSSLQKFDEKVTSGEYHLLLTKRNERFEHEDTKLTVGHLQLPPGKEGDSPEEFKYKITAKNGNVNDLSIKDHKILFNINEKKEFGDPIGDYPQDTHNQNLEGNVDKFYFNTRLCDGNNKPSDRIKIVEVKRLKPSPNRVIWSEENSSGEWGKIKLTNTSETLTYEFVIDKVTPRLLESEDLDIRVELLHGISEEDVKGLSVVVKNNKTGQEFHDLEIGAGGVIEISQELAEELRSGNKYSIEIKNNEFEFENGTFQIEGEKTKSLKVPEGKAKLSLPSGLDKKATIILRVRERDQTKLKKLKHELQVMINEYGKKTNQNPHTGANLVKIFNQAIKRTDNEWYFHEYEDFREFIIAYMSTKRSGFFQYLLNKLGGKKKVSQYYKDLKNALDNGRVNHIPKDKQKELLKLLIYLEKGGRV